MEPHWTDYTSVNHSITLGKNPGDETVRVDIANDGEIICYAVIPVKDLIESNNASKWYNCKRDGVFSNSESGSFKMQAIYDGPRGRDGAPQMFDPFAKQNAADLAQ